MSEAPYSEGSRVAGPVYGGRMVELWPVQRQDYPTLLAWWTDPRPAGAWFSGRPVSLFEDFAAEIDQAVRRSVTLLVRATDRKVPIGIVQASQLDLQNKWCFVRFLFHDEERGEGTAPEACLAFLNLIFAQFPLRKIYLEGTEEGLAFLGTTLHDSTVAEGRYRQHLWFDGEYYDLLTLAIDRDVWLEMRERIAVILDVQADVAELSDGGSSE